MLLKDDKSRLNKIARANYGYYVKIKGIEEFPIEKPEFKQGFLSRLVVLIPALFSSLFLQSFLSKMSLKNKKSRSIYVPDRNRENEYA